MDLRLAFSPRPAREADLGLLLRVGAAGEELGRAISHKAENAATAAEDSA